MTLSFLDAVFAVSCYALAAYAVAPAVIYFDFSQFTYLYYACGVTAARLLIRLGMTHTNAALSFSMERDLRRLLVDHLLAAGPLSPARSPRLPAVMVDAVDPAVPYFTNYMSAVRYSMAIPLVFLVSVFIASPLQGLILLLMAPLIPVFMVLIGYRAERLNQRQWLQMTRLGTHFQEAMRRINVIKLFNLERREFHRIKLLNKRWRVETMQVLRVAFLSALALEFFATVGVALCAVTLGFAVYDHGFPFVLAFFILLCAPEFFLPLRNLGSNYHIRMSAIGAVTQMVELLTTPASGLAYSDSEGTGEQKKERLSELASFADGVEIRLEGVSAQYPDGRYGLEERSFVFEKNRITALVGPSGSGKSTTLMLCAALLEAAEGRILVNGHDLRALDVIDYRRQVAYIPQNPYLFFGTLRFNLDLHQTGIPENELHEALRRVGAGDLITRFEDGLEHRIGDEHAGVSGGEARLIALARASLSGARILLLDEPTASLDQESEAHFLEALREAARGRTVIIAAHRQELIDFADNIVTLEQA